MITVSSTTTFGKVLQVILSVVLVGLTSKMLSNRSSISSVSDLLSDFNTSVNGTSLDLDNTWQIQAASLSSSLFTFVSTIFNYFYPTSVLSLFKNNSHIGTNTAVSAHNYIKVSTDDFTNSNPFTISAIFTSYLTSLTSSETISNVFWFVNMIIQIVDNAANECDSVSDLLDVYNLTGTSTTESLLNYFNIFDNSSSGSTTSEIYQSLYDTLTSLNITGIENIGITDLNGTDIQSELLLSLSGDCQMKKTSMALTIIMWITHIISSGVLTSEIFSFINKFQTTKTQALQITEQQKLKTTAAVITKTEGNDDATGSAEAETEQPQASTPTSTDSTETPSAQPEIVLTFTHRWGLFDIFLTNADSSPTAGNTPV